MPGWEPSTKSCYNTTKHHKKVRQILNCETNSRKKGTHLPVPNPGRLGRSAGCGRSPSPLGSWTQSRLPGRRTARGPSRADPPEPVGTCRRTPGPLCTRQIKIRQTENETTSKRRLKGNLTWGHGPVTPEAHQPVGNRRTTQVAQSREEPMVPRSLKTTGQGPRAQLVRPGCKSELCDLMLVTREGQAEHPVEFP